MIIHCYNIFLMSIVDLCGSRQRKVNWAKPHKALLSRSNGSSIPFQADYIALSFVQSAQDIADCRRAVSTAPSELRKHCESGTKIIAKIENVA